MLFNRLWWHYHFDISINLFQDIIINHYSASECVFYILAFVMFYFMSQPFNYNMPRRAARLLINFNTTVDNGYWKTCNFSGIARAGHPSRKPEVGASKPKIFAPVITALAGRQNSAPSRLPARYTTGQFHNFIWPCWIYSSVNTSLVLRSSVSISLDS